MRLFPLLPALFLPLPAFAQLAPGFWSFPGAPGLGDEELAALCETGFSLVYADGQRQSFLRVETEAGPALVMDSEVECRTEGDQTACAGLGTRCQSGLADRQYFARQIVHFDIPHARLQSMNAGLHAQSFTSFRIP